MEGYKTIKNAGEYLCSKKKLLRETGQFSLTYFNLHTKATNNYTFITVNTFLKNVPRQLPRTKQQILEENFMTIVCLLTLISRGLS